MVLPFVAAGVAAVVGGAVYGTGRLVYEGALNTRLLGAFANAFHKNDPDVDDLYNSDYNQSAHQWFEENKGRDLAVYDEKVTHAHAYVIFQENPGHKWVIVNHGYNSSPEATAAYAKHYYDLGYNTVSPCMRGFGHDDSHYCSMGHYDKYICRAWINFITDRDPQAQIVLHGYSMGAATVNLTLALSIPENVKAAVSDCSYTNVYEQYTNVLKQNVGFEGKQLLNLVNFISKRRKNFDFKATSPIDAAAESHTPTLFIHGDADGFVPFFMLDKMYEASAAPKEKLVIKGAKHAVSVFKDTKLYWNTVDDFLKKYITD